MSTPSTRVGAEGAVEEGQEGRKMWNRWNNRKYRSDSLGIRTYHWVALLRATNESPATFANERPNSSTVASRMEHEHYSHPASITTARGYEGMKDGRELIKSPKFQQDSTV